MKPHEETWYVASPHRVFAFKGEVDDTDNQDEERLEYDGEDVGKLAAQAPAMARLLLELEWSGRAGPAGDVDGACPSCERERPEPHAPDCELATVLRAAGVLP
jgi:hypothetical protein